MIISSSIFDSFYEENKSKLNMLKPVNYPISHNNLNIWLNNIKNSNNKPLIKFGYEFAQTLTHISYNEFYENLWKLGITLLQKFNDSQKVYVYIGGNLQKSNLWVTLLLWPTIKPIIKGLLTDIPKNFTDTILYIDDCSYSGNQVIKFINNRFPQETFINNLIVCNVYISKYANTLISKKCNVIFITELQNFNNAIINDINDVNIKNFLKLNNKNLTNVYFDHKLASGLSIFQGILAFGLYPPSKTNFNEYDWRKKMTVNSLIRGCENFYNNENIGYLYLDSNDFHEDYKNSCPLPFYKTINYTFNNIKLNDIEKLI